jgi:hypothetical protein
VSAEPAHAPGKLEGSAAIVTQYDIARRRQHLLWKLSAENEQGRPIGGILKQIAGIDGGAKQEETHSILIDGINSYPTIVPPETVLLGNDWGRRGDIIHLVSTAGNGKSVAMIQAGISWALGLSYMGIKPTRPLRILIFSGEDDGTTIGQCREGFLEHSKAITGTELEVSDLDKLDGMIRTEFAREFVGERFHGHLVKLLADFPADLVIINPLLSYLGGEVVAVVSTWLRAGLMPVLQAHNCAALIAHHTPKMAKDGWDNTDDTRNVRHDIC